MIKGFATQSGMRILVYATSNDFYLSYMLYRPIAYGVVFLWLLAVFGLDEVGGCWECQILVVDVYDRAIFGNWRAFFALPHLVLSHQIGSDTIFAQGTRIFPSRCQQQKRQTIITQSRRVHACTWTLWSRTPVYYTPPLVHIQLSGCTTLLKDSCKKGHNRILLLAFDSVCFAHVFYWQNAQSCRVKLRVNI